MHEARLWRDDGWTARVIKNEDDEGWAVEMIKDGEAEPALVGPCTMGRNKKDPKPLDTFGEQLAQVQVAPSFKLSKASAAAWVENEFRRPG
ncbi:hypothetical protein OKW30_000216 [Paraburkholderia sp. Clong3]